MADEIINRVSKSPLITLDLEDFYPSGNRIVFDLKDWLYEELILKEKDFRENLSNHDWTQYNNAYVAITCTADAIVPSWAYMLVATYLTNHAKRVIQGTIQELDLILYTELIQELDISEYTDKKMIIKGCAKKPVPPSAYILLIERLQPIANSLMFGEACSTVPLYKKKK